MYSVQKSLHYAHVTMAVSREGIQTAMAKGLPSVVLRIEQEVRTDDGDTHSDHHHDQEDQQHEAKHVVDLVLPERREDEIAVHERVWIM